MNKLFCICLLILSSPVLRAQTSWLSDSLKIYDQKIESASDVEDFEAMLKHYKVIFNAATKSLDPAFYDRFEQAVKSEVLQNDAASLGRIYQYKGTLEFYKSDYKTAGHDFKQASALFQQAGMDRDAAGMNMNLGVIQEKASTYDAAIVSYKGAMVIFVSLQDTSSVANCLENISLAYQRKGEFNQALKYFEKTDSVLKSNTPLTSPRWIGFYYNKSDYFNKMGNYDQALSLAMKGLSLSEKTEDSRQIAHGYMTLLRTYDDIGDDKNWIKYVEKAKAFYRRTENDFRLAELDNKMGYYYLRMENPDSATYAATKALNFYKENEYESGISATYILLGNIDYKMENYADAIDDFKIALDNLPESKNQGYAGLYHNLGSSYMHLGSYTEANNYLKQSLAMRKIIGSHTYLQESYQTMAECMEKQGDYKQAYTYFKLSKTYQDSIFNETKAKQITEIQSQYDSEKKDQAIANLEQQKEIQTLKSKQKDNQVYASLAGLGLVMIAAFFFYNRARLKHRTNLALSAKNKQIEARDKEKETLLKEIHHRVKNNLQVISSLLSMQSRGLTDVKVKDVVVESQSRVKTMALIHERLYQYENLSQIAMKDYMQQLSEFLHETYCTEKNINIVIDVDDVNLDIDIAIPLGLITNELLSNALKYAFAEKNEGEITLTLSENEPGGYRLTVSDTGKGLSDDMDIEKSTSLGLKLVRTLTRQISGELNISKNPGATFSVSFRDSALAA